MEREKCSSNHPMKFGYYVEDLLEYDGHGNPFYDMIIEMMKKYQELDEKSKTVIREYFKSVGSGLKRKGRRRVCLFAPDTYIISK